MKINQTSSLNRFANLIHCFTSKKNGNLAFHVGDDVNLVTKNHQELSKLLDYELNTLVFMNQIHSNHIHIIKDGDNFTSPPTCDALITNRVNTPLMVMSADCAPIILYDAIKKVIAVAHAGRAGAFTNIVKNVISSFKNDFSSDTKDIYITIGSNIHSCCYEVGDEIYDEAQTLNLDYAIEHMDSSHRLDINKILISQLQECGINPQNVEISNICTACSTDTHYSYRAEKDTGRFAGVVYLKE